MINIYDIQRGSFHDGPGIRTVVFLKGCNLNCFWCQNPESQSRKAEILYFNNLCIGCRSCTAVCAQNCLEAGKKGISYDRTNCTMCGRCVGICSTAALQLTGKRMNVNTLYSEIMKDKAWYELSGGGVTLSGGEPLLQVDSCIDLLKMCRGRIHTAIESAICVPWTTVESVLPYLDLVIVDLKMMDEKKHEQYCGTSNRLILQNLKQIGTQNVSVKVRTPIIPGVNDTEDEVRKMAKFLVDVGIQDYELLPFHKLGSSKYTALDRKYAAINLKTTEKNRMDQLSQLAAEIIHHGSIRTADHD